MLELRTLLLRIIPRWLQNGVIFKVLYACAAQLDALAELAIAGMRKRFPEVESEDVADLLGHDRQIIRGVDEPWSTYAVRLRMWLDAHRSHGGPYALLRQLQAYWAVTPFVIEIYYAGTVPRRHFSMAVDGTISRDFALWSPTGAATRWSRWQLYYHWPTELPPMLEWGAPGLKWGSGRVWGSGLTSDEVASIRRVPRQWGNAHSLGIVTLEDPSGDIATISLPPA